LPFGSRAAAGEEEVVMAGAYFGKYLL
jgi:hypothetical protein